MNKHEVEQALLDVVAPLTTWAEAYDWFDTQARNAATIPHPLLAYGALFTLHAFLRAMRDLPDEGDIQALLRRMVHILVHERGPADILGVDTLMMAPEKEPTPTKEQEQAAKETFASLLARVRKTQE